MKKYWFPSKYHATWNMHSDDMVKLLTGGKAKLPDVGMEARTLECSEQIATSLDVAQVVPIKVWGLPKVPHPTKKKNSEHRVMCECPGCGTCVSAGRLFQHRCKEV